jgi:hypothetical protein
MLVEMPRTWDLIIQDITESKTSHAVTINNKIYTFIDYPTEGSALEVLYCIEYFLYAKYDIKGGSRAHIPLEIAKRYTKVILNNCNVQDLVQIFFSYLPDEATYISLKKNHLLTKLIYPITPYPIPTQLGETQMNTPNIKAIETKTYFYGKESKDVTDDAIFNKIVELEGLISHLESVQNKPQKMIDHITKLKADIADCMKFCDTREAS